MKDTPFSVPKEPGRWRAIAMAAIVHAALLTFLWIGVNWQSQKPVEVEAEIWSPQAQDAAPLPPQPTPEPTPEPKPDPIVKEIPKAQPVEPPAPNPEIVLEQLKKRKEQERKERLAEQEQQKKLKQQKAEQERQDKLDKQKAEQDRKDKEKLADQKKNDVQKQAALDKKRKQDAADAKLQKQVRDEEMRRLTGAVGSGGSGEAAKSQGSGRADAGYADKIRGRIRTNTIFAVPDGLSGNPAVEYDVELLPDGSLRGEPRLRKSSGINGFDEAVKRAIERSQPFPPDKSGRVPSSLTVIHKPKD